MEKFGRIAGGAYGSALLMWHVPRLSGLILAILAVKAGNGDLSAGWHKLWIRNLNLGD